MSSSWGDEVCDLESKPLKSARRRTLEAGKLSRLSVAAN